MVYRHKFAANKLGINSVEGVNCIPDELNQHRPAQQENSMLDSAPRTLPYLLTGYGLPHLMGYLPTKSGSYHPAPLSPLGLLDSAQEMGLAGIEIPLDRLVPVFDGK